MRTSEPLPRKSVPSAANTTSQPIVQQTTRRVQSNHKQQYPFRLIHWNSTMAPYVIQGIHFFVSHRILWNISCCPLVWTLLAVVVTLCVLLPLAFIPQAIALSAMMTPWLGVPVGLLLALLELLVVIMIVSAIFLLPIMDRVFDQVLILRGHRALVDSDSRQSCCGCCSRVSFIKLLMALITLPVNLIPVVGTVLWLFLNGRFYAWDSHSHYLYELKQQNFQKQKKFVRRRWYAYTLFGMQAMALEMIPIANVFFAFTNMVAAALWAADMEDESIREKNNNERVTEEPGMADIQSSYRQYATEDTNLPTAKANLYGN